MKGKKYKFNIGDRVVYKCRGMGGRLDLHGKHGVVKHISEYAKHHDCDVEFDEPFPDCMDLAHFRIKPGHGWACTEEHLDSEVGSDEEEDPDIKKQKKEEERTMAKRIDWESADFIIKRMMDEGKTQEEIAENIGCSKRSITERVALMKRSGEDPNDGEEKAELNDLEEALAAVISEQKEEIDLLKEKIEEYEGKMADLSEELLGAKRLAVKKEERIKELESELEGALEAKKPDCMDGIRETLARYDARIKEISEERDRYLRLVIKLSESVVGL